MNPGNYRVFECIFCHEHSNKTRVDNDHDEVSGYSYQSSECYRCHRNGVAGDSRSGFRRLR